METYKEFFLITLEMCFAIFVAIFGYTLWDNFDQTEYELAKYYDNTNEYDIYLENNNNYISLLSEENSIDSTKLYLHNISDKENITKLSFKISKENEYLKDIAIINIDDKYYELNKLECISDDYFYYFVIDNINFLGYETKEYNIKILLKDNINKKLSYEFVAYV